MNQARLRSTTQMIHLRSAGSCVTIIALKIDDNVKLTGFVN